MPRPAIEHPELLPLADGLSSRRVVLRRYRVGDGATLFAALAPHREELLQWMEWPRRHQRIEDSESYARRMNAEFALRRAMPMAILNAAGLSFIGLGVRPPTAEWGIMVAEGASLMVSGEWWIALFPGLALMIAVFCFNLLGDGLRDIVDPQRRT